MSENELTYIEQGEMVYLMVSAINGEYPGISVFRVAAQTAIGMLMSGMSPEDTSAQLKEWAKEMQDTYTFHEENPFRFESYEEIGIAVNAVADHLY